MLRLLILVEEAALLKTSNNGPAASSGLILPKQAHDEHALEGERSNYFTASCYYCVETICVLCGVVIAWTKIDKSESPTKILEFLEKVYPTEESKSAYICIDKACLVLHTAVANGSWDRVWKSTTRFIVDAYHYINHRAEDYLCRKWCNPAPKDGSAPNLVVVAYDNRGNPYYKRAFNTQTCEQLNAWLGGFDSIIRRMKPSNFDCYKQTLMYTITSTLRIRCGHHRQDMYPY
ncbi:hypothetical protein BDZ94DRAFT_1291764 [Collybia nuda]|uniref:Uncharacterized protein n=1 Tax=Collybia nuda TaxID=64659 RepID=A0A9P6CFJ5_9AGAR|nr:hypothetical protein BDZ94DRAFT_1291764 [Collybia nuda]